MLWFFATVLFVSINGKLTDAECHCSTATACAQFPSTSCFHTGNADRCQEGWYGPYCQKQNIALGRRATQSSTFIENSILTNYKSHSFEAWYGVDGRATTDFYSQPLTCSNTNHGDLHPTWSVHLNTSDTDQIQHIKLYLRQNFLSRNRGMAIYVGGRLCYQWPWEKYPPAVADVRCEEALTGNNLAIQTRDYLTLMQKNMDQTRAVLPLENPGALLIPVKRSGGIKPTAPMTMGSLTTVYLRVCGDGWFGENCDKQCQCSLNTEVCDKITGECQSGCAPGYFRRDCQTVCFDGYFGANCKKMCQCALNTEICDKITGQCQSGCAPGYMGPGCQSACPSGYYGLVCGFQCGGNCVDGVCVNTNGMCLRGCTAGWISNMCNQSCPEGRYGVNCVSPCGHCQGSGICDRVTGKCPGGCQPGWWPDLCSQACSDGRYGHLCQSECGQCKVNLPCNKTNGTCDQGCRPGFQEPFCKECADGWYGDDCISRCGQCKDALTCDKSSGECPIGCHGNFMKPLCQDCTECPATSGYSNQVPVAATVSLGTLLVLAIIGLLTSIIYNRRLKSQLDALQRKYEDKYKSLDERTKVVENTYEHLDNITSYDNAVPQDRI